MTDKLDAALELERRGELTPDLQAALNELRRRGAVPSETQVQPSRRTMESSLRPDASGFERVLAKIDDSMPSGGAMVAKGVRDAFVGLGTLPFDVAGSEMGPRIREAIPQVPTSPGIPGAIESGGAAVLQYGAPAMGAAKATQKAVQGLRWFSSKFGQRAAQIAAAALADLAVTDPDQAATLGTMFDAGPTAIRPEDTPLERRQKVGTEGGAIGAVVDPLFLLGRATGRGAMRIWDLLHPRATAERVVAESLQEAATDVPGAIQSVEQTQREMAGLETTLGRASEDPGLIGMEKGATLERRLGPRFAERERANQAVVASELRDVTQEIPGAPEEATRLLAERHAAEMESVVSAHERATKEWVSAEAETKQIVEEFTGEYLGEAAADASELIDRTVRDELTRLTKRKNILFDAIDPEHKIPVSIEEVEGAYKLATARSGPLDVSASQAKAVPEVRRLQRLIKKAKKGEATITYGDLTDLRPHLAAAIEKARLAKEGALVLRLVELKQTLDEQVTILADGGYEPAIKAVEFFRNEFAPKFRDGIGGRFAEDLRRMRAGATPPSATAARFLRPDQTPGAREAAQDLVRIISDAPTAPAARAEARRFLAARIAFGMRGKEGGTAVKALDNLTQKHSEALRLLPELKQEITAYRRRLSGAVTKETQIERVVKEYRDAVAQTEKEWNVGAARFFLDEDPVNAMGRVMRSKNPVTEINTLLKKTGGDKNARLGLRAALGKHLDRELSSARPIPGNEGLHYARLFKVEELFKDPKMLPALRRLYTADEIATLAKVRDRLRYLDRLNEQVAKGSPTALNLQSISGTSARIILASFYGIVKGRGIFKISEWIGDSIRRMMGVDSLEQVAQDLLADAMLDPQLGKLMLQRDIGLRAQKERLNTFITNNLVAAEPDEKSPQRQSKRLRGSDFELGIEAAP